MQGGKHIRGQGWAAKKFALAETVACRYTKEACFCGQNRPNSPRTYRKTAMAPPPTTTHRTAFLLIFLGSLLMLGMVLRPFWQMLFLALVLASVFHPVYRRLLPKASPWSASLLTCALIALCVFLPLALCISAASSEIPLAIQLAKKNAILSLLQRTIQGNTLFLHAKALLADFGIHIELEDISGLIAEFTKSAGVFIYNQASAWTANIMRFVAQFCILMMIVFFLLIEFQRLGAFILKLSPLPETQNRLLIKRFSTSAGAILVGNSLSGVIQGVGGGLFFAVTGLPSPVLWGTVMAVAAFMPVVGVGLVMLPAALILSLNGHGWQAVITVIFYLILTVAVDYLFKPRFVGGQAQLPPLLVLLSILGGINLFGLLGIISGPLALTAFLTLVDMYAKEYQPYLECAAQQKAEGTHLASKTKLFP